ncbi:helix-turn-helix domain-containing protein [archaeon]|nr:MAG: helix-turn-helix domain-containing protein [archaeon]
MRNVLDKWKTHCTIKDLPKKGRKPKVDDRTRRRLARMMQRGEVSTSSELALTAASCDIALISESTVCNYVR